MERIIGYEFKYKSFLVEALTHKSYNEQFDVTQKHLQDYERLEFLGGSILSTVIAEYFYNMT